MIYILQSNKTQTTCCRLQDNITIERLNLEGNWMEADGAKAMAKMLEENDYISDVVSTNEMK
jgi:hypothetical protein